MTYVIIFVIVGFVVLIGIGLAIEKLTGKKDDVPNVRQRPRFVQTLIRATIRRRRDKRPDEPDGE